MSGEGTWAPGCGSAATSLPGKTGREEGPAAAGGAEVSAAQARPAPTLALHQGEAGKREQGGDSVLSPGPQKWVGSPPLW